MVDAVEFERISYPAAAESCPAIRDDVRAWLDGSGVPGEVARGVVLAVSEAIDNVVTHAYGVGTGAPTGATIDLTLVLDGAEVVVTIADHGQWAQPETTDLEHDATDRPAQHGRGIILMNSHVDEVAIRHDRDGTSVLLRSRLVREGA